MKYLEFWGVSEWWSYGYADDLWQKRKYHWHSILIILLIAIILIPAWIIDLVLAIPICLWNFVIWLGKETE